MVVALVATLAVARVGPAPPERCPDVDADDARRAAGRAVAWLAANQDTDGQWAYLVSSDGEDLGGYSIVRHAGVLLALYQAAAAGVPGARITAEGGLRWAEARLVRASGGRALAERGGAVPTGASALLAVALTERRAGGAEVDTSKDELLVDLGRFLAGQVEPSGAVLAGWDPAARAPVPALYSSYFTGEAFWALVRLHAAFPDEGWSEVVAAVLAYLPDRDRVEDRFPPTSDHWAAYALADLGPDRLDERSWAYARRLAGIIGTQVRTEATRWEGGPQQLIRQGPASGSGLGTLGEAGGALLRLFGDADGGVAERVRCTAGMLVARQAEGSPAVDGAWFRDGVTRMDDQQHAISALLAAVPALAAGAGEDDVGGGEDARGLAWVVVAALVVVNPGARRRAAGAALGLLAAVAVAATVLAGLSGPVLDGLEVSPASARLAAGAGVVAAAVAALVRPRSPSGDGVTMGAVVLLALSAGADDGVLAVAVGALAAAAAVVVVVPDRWRRPWLAAPVAVVAVLVGVDLAVDGVLGV